MEREVQYPPGTPSAQAQPGNLTHHPQLIRVDAPGGQPAVGERERYHLASRLGEHPGHVVLLAERHVEQEIPAPARAQDLPPQRAVAPGELVQVVDVAGGDVLPAASSG